MNMKGFKNILVVAGDDAAATRALLEPAIELAVPASGVVTLLDMTSRPRRRVGSVRRPSSSSLLSTPLHRLYDPGPDLRRYGVPVHHETAQGVPHLEILERVATFGHDLVVMSGDPDLGRSGPSGRSTTRRVMRSSPVPVLIQPEGGQTGGPIAVAVGPKDADDPADELSRKLVGLASSLARAFKRDLHVIHAWRLDGETMMRGSRLNYDAADIERMGREAQFEARMRVEELLADASSVDINTRVHIKKGHSGDVVPLVADALEPSVLVMGTLARQGIQGLVVGNTAERVARRSQSPILTVKPDGFLSPRMSVEEWTAQALPY